MLKFHDVKERRKFPRIREDWTINFCSIENDQFLKERSGGSMRNISGGGICFETEKDLKAGSMLAIEILSPDFPASIMSLGRVVRCKPSENQGRFEVAVEFWWIGWSEEGFQKRMGDFLRSKLSR